MRKNPHGLFVTVSNRLEQKSDCGSRHGDVARREARLHRTLINVRFAKSSSKLTKEVVVLYPRMGGPRHTACDECLIATPADRSALATGMTMNKISRRGDAAACCLRFRGPSLAAKR